MSEETVPTDTKRAQCLALLRDVTDQRDKLLAEYEAMALPVDESVREIDEDILQARQHAKKAEEGRSATRRQGQSAPMNWRDSSTRNAARAPASRTNSRAFPRRRNNVSRRRSAPWPERPTEENPPAMLWRAITLIACKRRRLDARENPAGQRLCCHGSTARSNMTTKAGRLAWKCANAFIEWATPARHRAMETAEKRSREAREQGVRAAAPSFSPKREKEDAVTRASGRPRRDKTARSWPRRLRAPPTPAASRARAGSARRRRK